MKKLPFSVDKIGRDFLKDTDEQKGEIDYTKHRIEGAPLDETDREYIRKDIVIVAKALQYIIEQGHNKLTTGADALAMYKKIMEKSFSRLFPVLPLNVHEEIKSAYKGGYAYIREDKQGIEILQSGSTYDVNSLYPDRMVNCDYPVQEPQYFEGQYQPDKFYPLYIQHFYAVFSLRENYLPTVQIKNNRFYVPNEYVRESSGMTELTMTCVDFELFQEHYHIHELQYIDGYKFRKASGIFNDYILPIYEKRQQTTGAEKALYKLLLNSLYGKFAKNPDTTLIIPTLENDCVRLRELLPQTSEPVYMPVGAFITAYARKKTIATAQRMYEQFIYADTDSVHILGSAPDWLDIDSKRLGAWKLENTFEKAKFLRPKRYIEVGEDVKVLRCCGLSDKAKKGVTWDNFVKGQAYSGNLKGKTVPGGVVLVNNPFILD